MMVSLMNELRDYIVEENLDFFQFFLYTFLVKHYLLCSFVSRLSHRALAALTHAEPQPGEWQMVM